MVLMLNFNIFLHNPILHNFLMSTKWSLKDLFVLIQPERGLLTVRRVFKNFKNCSAESSTVEPE